jgi:transcription termination factor Rho
LLETQLLPLAELQVTEAKRLAELGQLDTLLILDAVTRAYDAQLAVIDATLAEAEATVDLNALFWPSLVAEVEVKEDRP